MKQENRQLKITVDAQLASAFKAACKKSGVSMASEIAGYMKEHINAKEKSLPSAKPVRIATRRDRRGSIRRIVTMIAAVRDAEEAYLAAIPEPLTSGPAYEAAESAVAMIDEAISLLEEAFG